MKVAVTEGGWKTDEASGADDGCYCAPSVSHTTHLLISCAVSLHFHSAPGAHRSSVLLPLPVLPTTAQVVPPATLNDTPRSTGGTVGGL